MSEALRVAYQGEPGAFSEEAAHALLGEPLRLLPQLEFAGVGDALRTGAADRGVIPVENSIHGSVTAAYDVLASGEFTVLAQVIRPIRLCVAARPGVSLADVRRVISHPVALAQCQRFLRGLEGADAVATHDTAGAAREVADAGDPSVAALSSRTAAERYGLQVLLEDVQDRPDNQTRFLLIRRATDDDRARLPAGGQRLLLLVDLADAPGALVRVLSPLADHGVNLSSIQSRPAGEPWTYRFFIEVASTTDHTALAAALDGVRERALRVAPLGCYD
jgi:prephenate dehydratase